MSDDTRVEFKQPWAGWIASLDKTQTIRKVYVPKENKPQNIEKALEKMENYAKVKVINNKKGELTHEIIYKRNEDDSVRNKGRKRTRQLDNENTSNVNFSEISSENIGNTAVFSSHSASKETKIGFRQDERHSVATSDPNVKFISKHSLDTDSANNQNRSSYFTEDTSSLQESDIGVEGGSVVPAKDEISSYMLKNAMFYTIKDIRERNLTELTHLKVTKMIFQTLLDAARHRELKAFFLRYMDIFSYVNTHIRMVPANSAHKELTKHCKRIESFCEVILGILSQKP